MAMREIFVAQVEQKDVDNLASSIAQDVENGSYEPDVYEIARWLVFQLVKMGADGIKHGDDLYMIPNEVPKFVSEVLGPALESKYGISLEAKATQFHITPKAFAKIIKLAEHVIANTASREALAQELYDMFSSAFYDSIEFAGKVYTC